MSATPENFKRINAQKFIGLTGAQATQALEIDIDKNPKERVNGTGAAIFYKIGNEFYIVGGYRSEKFLWVNGGNVKENSVLDQQLEQECREETFDVLALSKNAKMHNICGAYTYPFGTYITFIYVDTASFSSKEELDAAVEKMNPPAQFYNELFMFFMFERKKLTAEQQSEKAQQLIDKYNLVKDKLLINVANANEQQFLDDLKGLKDTFITDWKIGEYSERSHYEALTLTSLKDRLEKDREKTLAQQQAGEKGNSSFFANHTHLIRDCLMPEIEKAIENTQALKAYSGRSGSPTLYQPAPVATPGEEAQKSTLTPNHV